MSDASTKTPLRLFTHSMSERSGPYIRVPLTRLKEIEQILDAHGIRYVTEENALSVNGGPYMIVINTRPGTDPQALQAILDGIP